jgi:hypothetical protein
MGQKCTKSDEEIVTFIDRYVSCALPDDEPEFKQKVLQSQKHNHSNYCRKKNDCRFGFPKPPSNETLIAREPEDENKSAILKRSRAVLQKVKQSIEDEELMEECTDLQSLLAKCGLDEQTYKDALSVSQRKTTIVLKRSLQEKCINQYNATLYKAWGANLDIQFVVDPFAVIMYIAAYMTKSERNMGELLKQTAKEYRDADIHKQLKKLGSTFLNKREVSAQEAAYRMLAIPLRKFSREIVFVNTDKKCDRAGKLKHHTVLQDKDDDDCDIFETSLLDRYAARPDSHSQMSLATFASNYSVNYGRNAQQNDAGGENENEEPANNN